MTSYYDLLIFSIPTIEKEFPNVYKAWVQAIDSSERTTSRTLDMILKSLEHQAHSQNSNPVSLLDQYILEDCVEEKLLNSSLVRLITMEEKRYKNRHSIIESDKPKEPYLKEKKHRRATPLKPIKKARDTTRVINEDESIQVPADKTFHKIRKALSGVDKNGNETELTRSYFVLSNQFEEHEPISALIFTPNTTNDTDDKAEQINELTHFLRDAVNRLDDKAGDIFTLMVYKWLFEKPINGVVSLSYKDVMEVCGYGVDKAKDGRIIYRTEHTQEITSRMAALMGVSYIDEHRQEKIITTENEEIDVTLRKLKRLFLWEGVTELRHTKTGEFLGIQEFSFMPSPLFAETLELMKEEIMHVDTKILEYKDRDKYVKRIGYFLEHHWTEQRQNNIPYSTPFLLSDIIKDINYPLAKKSLAAVKKSVESWFNILHIDGILGQPFEYTEPTHEKGLQGYLNSKVQLLPSDNRSVGLKQVQKKKEEQQSLPLLEEKSISPTMVQDACKQRGLSYRKLAIMIGVSESTIRRYANGNGPKKPNKKMINALLEWLYN